MLDGHSELCGVSWVEGVIGIDPRGGQAFLLQVSDALQQQCALSAGRRAEEFRDASARKTTNAERSIERRTAGGDGGVG